MDYCRPGEAKGNVFEEGGLARMNPRVQARRLKATISAAEPPPFPAVFKAAFYFILVSPPPEGPDCHFPKEIIEFEPIWARVRGNIYFQFSC